MTLRGMAVLPLESGCGLLLRGGINDVDDAATDEARARALRHVDPRVRVRIAFHVSVACVRRRGAVVLAGLDDSGALLFVTVVVGSHCARGERGAREGEHARDGEADG